MGRARAEAGKEWAGVCLLVRQFIAGKSQVDQKAQKGSIVFSQGQKELTLPQGPSYLYTVTQMVRKA